MNRLDLRTRLRESYLDDTAAPYLWDDDLLNAFIEEAQQEAQIRSRFLSSRYDLSIEAGQGEYSLPPGTLDIERFRIPRLSMLAPISLDELDGSGNWEDRSGIPTHYAFVSMSFGGDDLLTLYPKPTAGYTATITLSRLPAKLATETNSPELPEHLHLYLLDWAAFRAYSLKDSDTNDEARAAKHQAAFIDAFGERHDADAMKRRTDKRCHKVRMNSDYW